MLVPNDFDMQEKKKAPQTKRSFGGILFFIGVVLVFAFIGLQLIGPTRTKFRQNQVRPGRPAPDFQYPDKSGRMTALADFRGKVVLLNIWATWCRPCVEEMPSMERLYRQMKETPFEIVAVSVDAEGWKAIQPFVDRLDLSFPILSDTEGRIRNLYGTTGIPESFIIAPDGAISKKIIGPLKWDSPETINTLINPLFR